MSARGWLALALSAAALSALPALPAAADGGTRTSTSTLSAEDLELARYLDLLNDMELLERMDMVSVLAALDEEDEP